MAPKTLRQLGILAVLLLVLMAVVMYNQAGVPAGSGRTAAARPRATGSAAGKDPIGAVKLAALNEARVEPESGARNPFRFRPVEPPAPAAAAARPVGPGMTAGPTAGPPVPVGPPPPPPITLRFIGVVEQNTRLKLAVLSDGRNVFYGKEGDAIEGRYRILRIGPESVDMAYLDGRGRQTLRLSGS